MPGWEAYTPLFVLVLLDAAGLPLPGELLLLAFGALAWSATFIGGGALLGAQAGMVGPWLVSGLGAAVLAALGILILRRQTVGAGARAAAHLRAAAPRARRIVSNGRGDDA